MTTQHQNTDKEAAPTGIRQGVWLLVLGSGLVVFLGIFLLRPDVEIASNEAAKAASDSSHRNIVAADRGSVHRIERRSMFAATKPTHQEKNLNDWVSDLESPDNGLVQAARQALADLGVDAAPAIPRLAQMLTSGHHCSSAAYTLVSIGTNSLPVLLEALTNGNRTVRLEAAGAIGGFRQVCAETILPALLECLKDPDPGVRLNALGSLQGIREWPEVAVPALIGCLADRDATLRYVVSDELRAFMKAKAETTLSIMVKAAREHENPLVRFRVGEIVRTIAPQRAEAEGL